MDAEQKTIYLEIPLSDFEHLHAEVKRLRNGWQDAEAQVAALAAMVRDMQEDLIDCRRKLGE